MIVKPFDEGMYGEALPTGEYAVLEPGRIVTHFGEIALDLGHPLYHRITNVGGFKIAGQAATGGGTLVWNGEWHRDPRIAHGQSGCIFDAGGNLRIIEPAPEQTSQGYRYVDEGGNLVLGDSTHFRDGVHEWTLLGGLLIGQGSESGAIAVKGADRRVLEPGDCQFIRFNRVGSMCAVSITKFKERRCVLIWFDESELSKFPKQGPAQEPTPPPPPSKPEIKDMLETVQRVRSKYPTPLGSQHAAFLLEVARETGFGLLRKDTGTFITLPDGVRVSQDILMDPASGRIFDILGDGEGAATPSWGEAQGSPQPLSRLYTPSGGPVVVDPPPVDENPPTGELEALLGILAELRKLSKHLGA